MFRENERLQCYKVALDKIFSGVMITDINGVVIYYNRAASEYENLSREQVLGRSVYELYSSIDTSSRGHSFIMESMKTGQPILNEHNAYATFDNYVVNVVHNYYPVISNGQIVGCICIINTAGRLEKTINEINEIIKKAVSDYQNLQNIGFQNIIGQSLAVKQAINECTCVSKTDVDALIVGETGTGKELFVKAIHNSSSRRNAPFVPINCAAIPENLLESILFGTKKGAYTDSRDSIGLFEFAEKGTLLLDEINSMSLSCQTKLLRAIQEKKIRRVGAEKEISIDCRVIGAVNKDPLLCIQENTLRRDLFYRLSIACIVLPPLRERKEDLPLLVDYYIKMNNKKYMKSVVGLSSEMYDLLNAHDWDGNIRELINIIEAMFILHKDETELGIQHLSKYHLQQLIGPEKKIMPTEELSLDLALYTYEKKIITEALAKSHGNRNIAAKKLNISPQALNYKLHKFGLGKIKQ